MLGALAWRLRMLDLEVAPPDLVVFWNRMGGWVGDWGELPGTEAAFGPELQGAHPGLVDQDSAIEADAGARGGGVCVSERWGSWPSS